MVDIGLSLTASDLEQLRQDVIDSCQIIAKEGLFSFCAEGHPSARIPKSNRFITMGHLHPRGMGMNGVKTIDELVVLDTNMKKIWGKYEVMNEAIIHAAIFKARPDVGGVVYSHPPYCNAFANANKPIPRFGTETPVWDSKGAVENPERAAGMVKALGNKNAILLKDLNSLVTCGDTVKDAVVMVYMIERMAMEDYRSLLIGMSSQDKTKPPRNPRYPAKDFTYRVDEFGGDVVHFDFWKYLWDKHIARGKPSI